ncbi:Hypothetical predicted protein [Pelobates cultripes]|uniref:Uncharacterized protein n=1 Tax=Pelobates cultripes TaxID=61616 RepID=A0AAD1R5V7_PELCU|nr:Hypothetical predicted protein [Pelobates cultripes]
MPSGTTPPQLLTHTKSSPPGLQAKGQRAPKHKPHWRRNQTRKRQEKTSSPITPTRGGNPDPSGNRVSGKRVQASKPAWGGRDGTPPQTPAQRREAELERRTYTTFAKKLEFASLLHIVENRDLTDDIYKVALQYNMYCSEEIISLLI